jgi:hypothetical protein
VGLVGTLGCLQAARGQALPTAMQASSLSVFGGLSGVFTGISGGKNVGITAGVDYAIGGFAGFRPAIEVRGTYPIHSGTIDDQKSILFGGRVERPMGAFHPYGDFLIGRGEINYIGTFLVDGAPVRSIYLRTASTVYSPGAGVEYDLTHHFAARADVQFQHWQTPAVFSGSAWAKQATAAVTYRFDFNRRWKERRRR